MPANMEASAAKAIKRHQRRLLSPGVAVEVAKVGDTYVVASSHQDLLAWEAMVCDALGTRSDSTAKTFLFHLAGLCSQNWQPSEESGGEWCPDERELNMILNFVAGIKPKNEMEAALAAQMVAVHLMQMRLSSRALAGGHIHAANAAMAGKLARTFVMQIEALSRLKGKRSTSKQTITVRQEKHVHNHQHVHIEGERTETGDQPHEANERGPPGDCAGTKAVVRSGRDAPAECSYRGRGVTVDRLEVGDLFMSGPMLVRRHRAGLKRTSSLRAQCGNQPVI